MDMFAQLRGSGSQLASSLDASADGAVIVISPHETVRRRLRLILADSYADEAQVEAVADVPVASDRLWRATGGLILWDTALGPWSWPQWLAGAAAAWSVVQLGRDVTGPSDPAGAARPSEIPWLHVDAPAQDVWLACEQALTCGAAPQRSPQLVYGTTTSPKQWVRATDGDELIAAKLADVVYFQAERKRTRVVLPSRHAWMHLGISAIARQLDTAIFWRIHRSIIVNVHHLHTMRRDEFGRVEVRLRQRTERLRMSRPYERELFCDGLS